MFKLSQLGPHSTETSPGMTSGGKDQGWVFVLIPEISVFKFILKTLSSQVHQSSFVFDFSWPTSLSLLANYKTSNLKTVFIWRTRPSWLLSCLGILTEWRVGAFLGTIKVILRTINIIEINRKTHSRNLLKLVNLRFPWCKHLVTTEAPTYSWQVVVYILLECFLDCVMDSTFSNIFLNSKIGDTHLWPRLKVMWLHK